MAVSWRGFGPGLSNKTTPEAIYRRGKEVDEALACGKRHLSDLTKEERQALYIYQFAIKR